MNLSSKFDDNKHAKKKHGYGTAGGLHTEQREANTQSARLLMEITTDGAGV